MKDEMRRGSKEMKEWASAHFRKMWSNPEFRSRMSAKRSGSNNPFYGRKWSDPDFAEALAKLKRTQSLRYSGSGNPMFGRKRTEEEKSKISDTRIRNGVARGVKNPNWRGGTSSERKCAGARTDHKKWRNAVLLRDGWTCVKCGSTKDVEAHHILPWAYFPNLRCDVSNGEALCLECHKKTFRTAFQLRAELEAHGILARKTRDLAVKERVCVVCGRIFEAKSHRALRCGRECRNAQQRFISRIRRWGWDEKRAAEEPCRKSAKDRNQLFLKL